MSAITSLLRRLRTLSGPGRTPPACTWIVPLWCLAVVIFPNALAEFHDPSSSLRLHLLRSFFTTSLILLPWVLTPWNWLRWTILPIAVVAQLENLHIVLVGDYSSLGIIHSLFETTPQETGELLRQVWPILAVLSLFPLLTVLILWRHRSCDPIRLSKRVRWTVGIVAAVGGLSEPIHVLWFHRHSLHPVAIRVALTQQCQRSFPFGTLWKVGEAVDDRVSSRSRQSLAERFDWRATSTAPRGMEETYVVVLGESSRSGNWSAYGYPWTTTPRIQSDTELVLFTDMTSAANITLEAIPLLLTLATPRNPKIFDTTASVIACFRQAGFKTWWLSTQGRFNIWDGKPAKIGYEADISRFLGGEQASRKPLDETLLPALDAALADTATKKLIFLHTNGSHYPYSDRYPSAFDVFRPETNTSDTIASYDNSVLYTDWFVENVVDRLRARSEVAGFVYTSDHGEALGEKGRYFHCGLRPVRAEFEVPYLAWISPALAQRRPSVLARLRAHRHLKTSHADFLATLAGIAGIRSARIDSTRSLAGAAYRETTRWAITPAYALIDVDRLDGTSLVARPPAVP